MFVWYTNVTLQFYLQKKCKIIANKTEEWRFLKMEEDSFS